MEKINSKPSSGISQGKARKMQIINIGNERGDVTTNSRDISRTLLTYV